MSRVGGMNEDTRIIGLWTNISEQLGETSTTAYAGDKGKTLADRL